MSEQDIKPCPFCEMNDSFHDHSFAGQDYRRCSPCGTSGPFSANRPQADKRWNAMPRREDFHADLMELSGWIEKQRESAVTLPGSSCFHRCLVNVRSIVAKYAPAEREKDPT